MEGVSWWGEARPLGGGSVMVGGGTTIRWRECHGGGRNLRAGGHHWSLLTET